MTGSAMTETARRTPMHLWIVGVLSLLWNAIGALDYSATQLRYEPYMSQFTPAQLEYFYGIPAWAVATWAIAVWFSLLGSIGLLLRRRWAVTLFGIAIVGMLLTAVHSFLLSDGMQIMGESALGVTALIWVIAFALFFYARRQAARGLLR